MVVKKRERLEEEESKASDEDEMNQCNVPDGGYEGMTMSVICRASRRHSNDASIT